MEPHVLATYTDDVLEIILNRPNESNRMTMGMIEEITGHLDTRTGTQLVVLKARGEEFCLGRDYQKAPEDSDSDRPMNAARVRTEMTDPILAMYMAIKSLDVPSVSVVQGDAVGFGCALACSCDIVLAAEGARFCLPELSERGLPPTLALTALLDRASVRNLTYMAYSTELLDARQAQSAGLVSAVCSDGDLAARSRDLVSTITAQPADSVKAVKRYLKLAPGMDLNGRAELGANLFALVAASRPTN